MKLPPASRPGHLRELVAAKNLWMRQLTAEERDLGFLGWHERGHLPHCDFPGLLQFVTLRLADSLPASRRGEWGHLLEVEPVRERRKQLEAYLDRGHGECWLGQPGIARIAENALRHFHGDRYGLRAWCVMPNHVHGLIEIWRTPLWRVVKSWKQHIATQAEKLLLDAGGDVQDSPGRRPALRARAAGAPASGPAGVAPGDFAPAGKPEFRRQRVRWEREYWDVFMRDERQERTAARYIEANPVKAGLCRQATDWPFSSARFRDEFGRLKLPGDSQARA